MEEYRFRQGFLWGGACSGPQCEGVFPGDGKQDSIWEQWYREDPNAFYQQVGPQFTSNFYQNYQELIPMMRECGITSFRTSIQWSRVMTDREGTINPEGLAFYDRLVDALIANGIQPMLCLLHFDLPMYWMEKGGFERRETVTAFARYARLCFEHFSDRVKMWFTFNEPVVIPEQGYLYQHHYPLVRDEKRAVQVAYHIQLASSMAVREFRKMNSPGQIGIVTNLTPAYCQDPDNTEDQNASQAVDLIFNRSFLDPSVKGEYPRELVSLLKDNSVLPSYHSEDLDLIRDNTVDFVGVNYYHPRRVRHRQAPFVSNVFMPDKYFEYYVPENCRMNISRGWEIYEKGIYDIGINLRDNYGNIPWMVTENGMGVQDEEQFMDKDGMVQDDYRITFIKDHLKWLHRAIQEGCACFGYHMWSPFDSWSWSNAYKNRYGLIRIDIAKEAKPTYKKSAQWFRQLSDQNGFTDKDGAPCK